MRTDRRLTVVRRFATQEKTPGGISEPGGELRSGARIGYLSDGVATAFDFSSLRDRTMSIGRARLLEISDGKSWKVVEEHRFLDTHLGIYLGD